MRRNKMVSVLTAAIMLAGAAPVAAVSGDLLMERRVFFHVDVNSAFLSWTAAYQVMVLGRERDLRQVPSVIAGDKESRHSIILAKSIPAKKAGVQTGEALFQAQLKCPDLVVEQPDYHLYVEASRRFIALLRRISPRVEQYSIDEAFAEVTGVTRKPEELAQSLRR